MAADHYYFTRGAPAQLLLTEERTLRDFLDNVEEIRVEILEGQPLAGAAADIGVIADLIPHAFAIISLLTPIDRIRLDAEQPLLVGRHEGFEGRRESYARMNASFAYHGRSVRLVIDVGKGADDAKWIKLIGERRAAGRSRYKFTSERGGDRRQHPLSGPRSADPRGACRTTAPQNYAARIGNATTVGISRTRSDQATNRTRSGHGVDLLARNQWTSYAVGARPAFEAGQSQGRDRAQR